MSPTHYKKIYEIGKKLHDGIKRWSEIGDPPENLGDVARLSLRVWTPEEHDLVMHFGLEVGEETARGWIKTIVHSVCPGILDQHE